MAENYHPSVRHYHAPFPLAHRNARAFPRPRRGDTAAFHPSPANGDVGEGSVRSDAAAGAPPPSTPAQHPFASSSSSFLHCNPIAHSAAPLGRSDGCSAWDAEKAMRFNARRPRRDPYASPDEFADPLRGRVRGGGGGGGGGGRVPCGWIARPIAAGGGGLRKFPGRTTYEPAGWRPAPAHARELPEKITLHNPFRYVPEPANREGGDGGGGCRRVRELPATPLLEEVQERLRLQGLGSLVDVRFASDEAIAELLQACGFGPTQRMTILWELRRRFPV